MIKKLLIGLCIMLLLPIQAFATEDNFKVNADGAILLDADTGQILYEQNANSALGLASMSKLMTVYILLDQIGRASCRERV